MEHFIFHWTKIFVLLHEWENIHYLFYVTCTKIQFLNKFKRKIIENDFSSKQNILQAARPTLRGKYYMDACVMLNARNARVAFALRRVSHVLFSVSLILRLYCKYWTLLCKFEHWVQ